MTRTPLRLLLLALLILAPLRGQDPALRDTFLQAKAAWATQGDRETAAAKFSAVLAALEPAAAHLEPAWVQVLCETYNWIAILDDRLPAKRERAPRYLESALALNPDFEIDRNITNARLQGAFDALRGARYGKVTASFTPLGGTLVLDGKAPTVVTASPASHYMPPGPHSFAYSRPGYEPREQSLDLAPRDVKEVNLDLVRTSSAITLYTAPPGAELKLDGRSLGATQAAAPGQAAPELAAYAQKLGLGLDQISAGFVLTGLGAGKHLLEASLPCYQPRLIEIGESFTTPFADHELEPVKLEPSRAVLTLLSQVPGGELFLSGKSYGPVPVRDLAVCAQAYDLQVRFPAGAFAQRVELAEGQALTLNVRPKPRLTYAGFEGDGSFAGRERIERQLAGLGERLTQVAFATAAKGESPQDCLARLQASHETELVLRARLVAGNPVHPIELTLATLSGEEERLVVKALESDPLGPLVARLEARLRLTAPWAGVTLLDLPGSGPWVLQADAAALKARLKPYRPLQQVNGKPATTVADFRKALEEAAGGGQPGRITVSQGEAPLTLAVTRQPLELPVDAAALCYPFVLADLRLRLLGAGGDEASLLRLQQALVLIHFREFDKALEMLRDARMVSVQGVSQGTLDYYTGICLQHLGEVYLQETLQSFTQALKYPQATLFGPEGPLVAPLARQALDDLKP